MGNLKKKNHFRRIRDAMVTNQSSERNTLRCIAREKHAVAGEINKLNASFPATRKIANTRTI